MESGRKSVRNVVTHLLEGLRSISVFITTKIILCAGLVSVFARALFWDFI